MPPTKRKNPTRICILGNSGSGKTTLARKYGAWQEVPLVELDGYVWAAEQPPRMREDAEIERDLNALLAKHDSWIVEGCYAKWAELTLAYAPLLVFLDLSEERCVANCNLRPWQPEKFASKSAQDLTLPFLLEWVRDYYKRDDDMSRKRHEALFDQYGGPKQRVVALCDLQELELGKH